MSNSISNYIKESYFELAKKVTWPTWSTLQKQTLVVTVATIIIAIAVFGVDTVFNKAVEGMVNILHAI